MNSYRKLQEYFPEEQIRKLKDAIDRKVKPLGSLGLLEDLALEIALIIGAEPGDTLRLAPLHLIFAGDHGVAAAHPISIVSGDFTVKMINTFIKGGAAINAFLNESGIPFEIINSGIRNPEDIVRGDITVRNCSLGPGTRDLGTENAMTDDELEKAAAYGKEIAEEAVSRHCNVLLFGEMGIGNTTSASAIMAALTGLPPEDCTGRGTGIDDAALALKISLIRKGLSRLPKNPSPQEILGAVGGYEIAEMTYTMIHACGKGMVLVIDGFIVTAAALLAVKIAPEVRGRMIFATESGEPGHRIMLEHLEATPLLRLGLRLGEGTGAALSYSLIRAAAAFFSRMAEWDSANGRIIFHN